MKKYTDVAVLQLMPRIIVVVILGIVFGSSGHAWAEAAGQQKKASQVSPERRAKAKKLFKEAESDYLAGSLKIARKKMERAYKLVPSPQLAYNVGRLCERMGDAQCSVKFYKLYMKKGDPSEKECNTIRDRISEMQGLLRRQKQQVFTLPPSNDELSKEGRLFFERGVEMFKRKKFAAALQAFTAAMRFAPLPEMYYNLGVTSERLGNKRDAIDYFREYVRLRPRSKDRPVVERRIAELQTR